MVINNLSDGWRCSPSPSSSQPDRDGRGRNLYDSPKTVFQFASSDKELARRDCLMPPPIESIEHGRTTDCTPHDSEAWTAFQNAGAFSEKSIREKDRLTLISALAVLEKELYDYQYNMGLLLLERKSWASRCESLRMAASNAEEKMRRQDAAHSLEMSERSCRETLLRKTLDVEKQCTADLEKALRQLENEATELKASSDDKLAQAQGLLLQGEQKELLAKSKQHSAEALCAEANRRGTQTEAKLQEIESREVSLRREKQSFTLKLEAHASETILQEQSLKEWESKLQGGQTRLLHGEKLLSKRESCLNDKDECLRKAEQDMFDRRHALEEQQAKLLQATEKLKSQAAIEGTREQSLVDRELNVVKREQQLLILQQLQSSKEKETLKYEEELANLKQSVENQKELLQALQIASNLKKSDLSKQAKNLDLMRMNLENEKTCLEERRQRYEATALELQELHRYLETEKEGLLKGRQAMEATIDELDRRSKDVARGEHDAARREALLKQREQQAEVIISRTQKEEETMNRKQKNLAAERLNVEEQMKAARDDIQCMITEIEHEKHQIIRQRQKLHRAEQIHQQLQGDICKLKAQRETAISNVEGLRAERARYAKERNALEVKANKLKQETEAYQEERESMSLWLQAEEEKLKQERQESMDQFQREVEALLRDKEHLNQDMALKRSGMLSELNEKRQDLETNLLTRQKELEWRLDKEREGIRMYYLEKESQLLKEVKQEKKQIRASRESVMQAMKAIKMERILLDKERQQVSEVQKLTPDNCGGMEHPTDREKLKEQVTLDEYSDKYEDEDQVDSPVCIGESSVAHQGVGTPPNECDPTNNQRFEKFGRNGLAILCVALPTDTPDIQDNAPNWDGVNEAHKLDNSGHHVHAKHPKEATVANPGTESPFPIVESLTANFEDDHHTDEAQEQALDAHQHSKRKRRRSLVIQMS